MKTILLIITAVFIRFSVNAQGFSGEMSSGDKATNVLIRINQSFSKESRWAILGVVNSNMPYADNHPIYNYHFIQTALSYKIGVKSKIKTGAFIGSFKNPKHFGPLVGLYALYPFKNGIISLSNQQQFAKTYTTNLVAVFEFTPKINETLKLYSRIQIMSETDFNIATRSYQMVRLGLGYKKIQFGLAATFDQFKDQTIHFENYGLFIRTTL